MLEGLPHTDTGASGHHVGLRVAGLRHPDAVERLLGRIRRGGELPLLACCAEDLEAVRRHVAFASTGEPAADVGMVPEAAQEQRREPRWTLPSEPNSASASSEQEQAFPAFIGVLRS